jgi:hypothetical protein
MRAYELKQWIAASDWAKAHDEADKRRFDGSCRWFVEQNAYCAWARVDAAEDDRQNSSTRVLFVTGMPSCCNISKPLFDVQARRKARLRQDCPLQLYHRRFTP